MTLSGCGRVATCFCDRDVEFGPKRTVGSHFAALQHGYRTSWSFVRVLQRLQSGLQFGRGPSKTFSGTASKQNSTLC